MVVKAPKGQFIKALYKDIKAEVVAHRFPAGKRINVEHLAERKRVSTTPVREILNGLVAEQLVFAEPKLGFFMKGMSEVELRDLYTSNHVMLGWCLDRVAQRFGRDSLLRFPAARHELDALSHTADIQPDQHAILTGQLFSSIARQANNGEFIRFIANFNDRLQYVRTIEGELLSNPSRLTGQIYTAYQQKDFEEAQKALNRYYDTCNSLVSTIVAALGSEQGEEGLVAYLQEKQQV